MFRATAIKIRANEINKNTQQISCAHTMGGHDDIVTRRKRGHTRLWKTWGTTNGDDIAR
jgi:hypothetical protein